MAETRGHPQAPLKAPPFLVGATFAKQYYLVLNQQPQDVHKFYTDVSKLTRAEALAASAETVTTMKGIHEKVMSFDYGGLGAEIRSVDAQESLNGGVLVMVTGSLSSNHSETGRDFVQTFFLAPQDNGYYVLNDILRFLGDEPVQQVIKHAVPTLPNGVSEVKAVNSEQEQSKEQVVREVQVDEASQSQAEAQEVPAQPHELPSLLGQAPVQETVPEQPSAAPEPEQILEEAVMPGVPPATESPESGYAPTAGQPAAALGTALPPETDSPAVEAVPTESQANSTEPTPKKSYASILQAMKARAAGASSSAPAASAVTQSHQQVPAVRTVPHHDASKIGGATPSYSSIPSVIVATSAGQQPPVLPSPPISHMLSQHSGIAPDEAASADAEADARSIFVRNLPASIKKEEIAEHFKQFGAVKTDRIQIRGNRQANPLTVYAFVEFEEMAGAQLAVQKQMIIVKGAQARIEKKTSSSTRAGVNRRSGQVRNDRHPRDGGIRGRGSGPGYANRGTRAPPVSVDASAGSATVPPSTGTAQPSSVATNPVAGSDGSGQGVKNGRRGGRSGSNGRSAGVTGGSAVPTSG